MQYLVSVHCLNTVVQTVCIINAKMPTHPKGKQKHLFIIYIHIKSLRQTEGAFLINS